MSDEQTINLSQHPMVEQGLKTEFDEIYTDLPMSVKYRVQALRKLQLRENENKIKFEQDVEKLRQKFHESRQGLHKKRQRIILGEYEPTQNELLESVVQGEDFVPSKSIQGVPNFWLSVLQQSELAKTWVEEEDIPALKHLTDIRIVYPESGGDEATTETKFTIEFEFSANQYFHNKVLTKTYHVKTSPAPEDNPLHFNEPEVSKIEGCDIQWKSNDKNLMFEFKMKKQKNKKTGQSRTVPKVEKMESFFHFFKPPSMDSVNKEDEDEVAEMTENIELDTDLGMYLRDTLVPNAAIIFTNEFIDEECESSDDEDEDSDEEGEEESGDEDQEAPDAEKPECKQQ